MGQIERGLRVAVLGRAWAYDLLMAALGRERAKREVVQRYVEPRPGDAILDIGCGTARVLDHLPLDTTYTGVDVSPEYISAARRKYGSRAEFICGDVTHLADDQRSSDIILAQGLLHHLDDQPARRLARTAAGLLRPGGRLVCIDPVFVAGQSRVATFLISKDRGQNVRTRQGYLSLVTSTFVKVDCEVRHDLLRVPYSHNIMICHA